MSKRKTDKKPYQLIKEELPVLERAVRTSEYDELLDEFIKGELKTARVEYPDKSMKALMAARARTMRTCFRTDIFLLLFFQGDLGVSLA